MTIQIANVQNSQSFGAWLTTTNRLADVVSKNVVTADSSNGGSLTTGNSYVNGYFGARYFVVNNEIRGGNLTTNGVITIISNTNFSNTVNIGGLATANANLNVVGTANVSSTLNVGANVSVNTIRISIGNTTANVLANSTQVVLANSTNTATLTPVSLTIGVSVMVS